MTSKREREFVSLIVDDDKLVRDSISEILKEGGYLIDIASDGIEAINKVKKERFDAVFSDVWMPKMNGVDLLKKIKEYDSTIPVAMITGYPDIKIAVEAIKEGASDFITKPVRIDQVLVVIKKLLKERLLLLENAELTKEVEQKRTIENLNKKLHKKIKEISVLYSISETFSEPIKDSDLLDKIVNMACDITDAGKSSLMIVDSESKELIVKAVKGINEDIVDKKRIPIGSGIAGEVVLTGKHIFIKGLTENPHLLDNEKYYKSDSLICVPLKIADKVFGVLHVVDKLSGGRFTEEDLYLLLTLAKKGALRIENTILYESIYNNLIDTLKTMINAIEARDMYTRTHSQRVTELAMEIAREMGCSEEERETIGLAGLLHDIGKIGIRDAILLKPGGLSKEEVDVIKTHPIIGEKIVEPLEILPVERSIIRHHHERWDGKGYPDGLYGEGIPLLARILSVADAFDAMITDRPYRKAKSKEEAIAEIEELSGYQFDCDVVEKFKKVFH
ncbi:MAG: response regulator [Thermodesulfobacteriota bacterium]|nr:response regulator [Thermodesulfobacteriota bacterium]